MNVRVVLVRPRDPNNIGAAARAMKNFGFRDLWIVSPFPATWEQIKSAPHAMDVVESAHVVDSLAAAIADCNLVIGTGDVRRASDEDQPMTPLQLSERLRQASYRVALLFGNEKSGLNNEDLAHCHRLLAIPTNKDCPSMNLGQSVAVCLYELARERSLPAAPPIEQPTAATCDAATELARALLHDIGFVLPGNEDDLMRRIRAALLKYELSSYDLNMLCGIMQKTRRALRLKQADE
ncbi:MAG: TrmJ/YjtD family RNA methyltransferase [Acidobacteria bacterium]|nr:TrmJ/YjtD family RNA methyltransferase [Acidobacteriota bacterium]